MEPGDRAALQEQLTALARGEREAFDPLFRRLWPLLRGFARRCLPEADADDAAQEALLRVFSRASEFDARRDALTWVLAITAWQIRTQRTRARRSREDARASPPEIPDATPSPESAAIAAERTATLGAVLSGLSPMDVETLLAYARGDRPDLPAATFRKRLERALARLRALWRTDHGTL